MVSINLEVKPDTCTFSYKERYEWSQRLVTVNYLTLVDKHDLRGVARFKHDDGFYVIIPFHLYEFKDTICGKYLLVQRAFLFKNLENKKCIM